VLKLPNLSNADRPLFPKPILPPLNKAKPIAALPIGDLAIFLADLVTF